MIRKATVDDAGVIARIHVHAWREAYRGIVPDEYLSNLSEEKRTVFWRQQISANRSVTLVAIEGEEVVGWVSGGLSQGIGTAAVGEIYAIYISPAFWRRGIGQKLMAEVEDALSGMATIVLWVLRENQSALRFYAKLGYHYDDGEKEADFGSVKLAEIRLRKKKPNQ